MKIKCKHCQFNEINQLGIQVDSTSQSSGLHQILPRKLREMRISFQLELKFTSSMDSVSSSHCYTFYLINDPETLCCGRTCKIRYITGRNY
jgi:hypothetical protein